MTMPESRAVRVVGPTIGFWLVLIALYLGLQPGGWLRSSLEQQRFRLEEVGGRSTVVDGQIVAVMFVDRPATDEALALLDDPQFDHLQSLQINAGFYFDSQDERGREKEVVTSMWHPRKPATSECRLTDAGLQHLSRLRLLERLAISLESTSVTPAGLAALGNLTNLKELQIAFNDVCCTPEAMQVFESMTALESLCLTGGPIPDAKFWLAASDWQKDDRLRVFAGATKLQKLYLDGPLVTQYGLVPMLAQMSDLKEVHLSGLLLNADGVEALRGRITIDSLFLTGGVGNAGLQTIGTLTGLREVFIWNNFGKSHPLTDAGLEQLGTLTRLESVRIAPADHIDGSSITTLNSLPRLSELKVAASKQSMLYSVFTKGSNGWEYAGEKAYEKLKASYGIREK